MNRSIFCFRNIKLMNQIFLISILIIFEGFYARNSVTFDDSLYITLNTAASAPSAAGVLQQSPVFPTIQ